MTVRARKRWWRPFSTDPPSRWWQTRALDRGVADELLRRVDEDGSLHIGEREPHDAIAFAIAADPDERKALKACVARLIEGGWITVAGDGAARRLTLRHPDLELDDGRLSSGYGPSKVGVPSVDGRRSVGPKPAKPPDTGSTIREEKSRSEEIPPTPQLDTDRPVPFQRRPSARPQPVRGMSRGTR